MPDVDFWSVIAEQLAELRSAESAADVVRILSAERNPYGSGAIADGFFAGSVLDDTAAEALEEAGWRYVWSEANYYYAMRAPNGDTITYIEGDIYVRDTRADSEEGTA